MSYWIGSGKDKAEDMLKKIEQIVAEKTKRLSSIEESLQKLAEQIAQPSCSAELEKLQRERDNIEEKNISLQEENLNLRKQIFELRRSGASPNDTPQSADTTELREQLEQAQQELKARDNEIVGLREGLEQLSTANDANINEFNARVEELQQQLAAALADKEAYAGQAALLNESQKTADALNTRVEELRQQLADAQTETQTSKQHITVITAELEQTTAHFAHSREKTTQLQALLNSSQEQEKQLSEQLRSTQDELATKSTEAETLTNSLSSAETLIATLQEEKAALTEQLQAGQKEIETFHQMEKRFFPDCILIPALSPYISDWQAQFISSEPDYRVLSMFSYLFSWSSLMEGVRKSPDSLNSNVEKEAISTIAYFSRYFLEALYAKGMSTEEVQNISLELIERFNNVLNSVGTKHQLFVPYLGESYDNKTMAPDSTRGNTFGVVEALLSWGIHNPETEISYSKCQVQLG